MRYTIIAGTLAAALGLIPVASAGAGENGRGSATPGYFDCQLFTILHKDIPEGGAEALAERNGQVNLIFTFPGDSNPEVVDALPTQQYNPLWQEVEVTWNVTPHLLCSADQIFAAEESGEVTLEFTDEFETCPVVGGS
jgi:hypothetical protein